MGASSTPDCVVELSEGLSLVPCNIVSLSFVRADVSVKPVDEWQLKEGLTAMFKKRFGLAVADRDLVVQREKNYFKKRRDEPIADGTLHLWGSKPEGETAKVRQEGVGFGQYVVDNVNGVELNVGGLKVKCIAVIKETNDFEAIKRSWEVVFGPRRGGSQAQAGPTTLVLKGVPSRWFAEPRVSSKPSVLVTHTIFSGFGEIRNLEVLGNEDLGKNPKAVGSMAAALQCQIWVQFDSHANFCKALHAFCGRAMQKPGSNFRATYVIDWDKENYFNAMNVRRRKFEKERLERAAAEKIRKEEIVARQAEFARVEEERLKMEQMAIALREEEERQQQLAEQAQKLEESRKQMLDPDTSSEEEGLIQDERQESSDDEMPPSGKKMNGRVSEEDEGFSPLKMVNGRYMSGIEGERHLLQVRDEGSRSSEDEEALYSSRPREKRRYISEDDEEEDVPPPHVRDKRRYTPKDRKDTVSTKMRAKRRSSSDDEELRHIRKKRRDKSEDEEERHLSHVRKKRKDTSEDEAEAVSLEVRDKRKYSIEDDDDLRPPSIKEKQRYTSEDEEEQLPSQNKEKRRHTSDEEGERFSPGFVEKRGDISKDVGRNIHVPEESADQEMYNPLERWQPEEETAYYSKLSMGNVRHEDQRSGQTNEGRMASRKRSPSPLATDEEEEEEESEDDEFDGRESGRGQNDFKVERWALEVTHSVASLSASEALLQSARHMHKGRLAEMERSEKRLRSVIMFST